METLALHFAVELVTGGDDEEVSPEFGEEAFSRLARINDSQKLEVDKLGCCRDPGTLTPVCGVVEVEVIDMVE